MTEHDHPLPSRKNPIASLSLDLDNEWSYLKTRGQRDWESFPSYLDLVVPRFLEILEELKMKITVFVVGQDAALDKNREALASIPAAGHEVGNHSFHHEPWLHLYSLDDIRTEFERAEEAIETATGLRPLGFRGPGYSLSDNTLQVLSERDYAYDASTLPTFLGPLARAYYFMTTTLSDDEKEERKKLFGEFKQGFLPLRPYHWEIGGNRLLEIPVTTLPWLKVPFHFSYVIYLSTFSAALARFYFRTALRMCRLSGVEPSLLLHPLDFLGKDDLSQLSFFPAMNLESGIKIERLRHYLEDTTRIFTVHSMGSHAKRASGRRGLKVRKPVPSKISNPNPDRQSSSQS